MNLTDIRLIATDLDGSLLTVQRTIPQRNIEAIRAAIERGITVCLASGRIVSSIRPFKQQLGIDAPIVSCNGAYVLATDGSIVHDFGLPGAIRDRILDYAAERDLHVNLYSGEQVFMSSDDDWADTYIGRVKFVEPIFTSLADMRKLSPTKILFMDTPEAIKRHDQTLAGLFRPDEVAITISEPEYIEFLPAGINKGTGLQALASHMGLRREQVAAVGDWMNDLEMIEWAGYGGAVANGHPTVRAAADIVVADHEAGGVGEFIESVVYNSVGRA